MLPPLNRDNCNCIDIYIVSAAAVECPYHTTYHNYYYVTMGGPVSVSVSNNL